MDRLFKITLIYQKLNPANNTRFTASYNLPAAGYIEALTLGIQRLGSNQDGQLFSVSAEEIIVNRDPAQNCQRAKIRGCQYCDSTRLLNVSAKASDCVSLRSGEYEHHGEMPDDVNLGGGDYVRFTICLYCGHVQGGYPLPLVASIGEGV